jgi:hypothetical protein
LKNKLYNRIKLFNLWLRDPHSLYLKKTWSYEEAALAIFPLITTNMRKATLQSDFINLKDNSKREDMLNYFWISLIFYHPQVETLSGGDYTMFKERVIARFQELINQEN